MINGLAFFNLLRLEAMLWSCADLFLIWYSLRLVDVIREQNKLKTYRWAYAILIASFATIFFIPFITDFSQLMIIEIISLNIQYGIIITVFLKNRQHIINAVKQLI